MNGIHESRKIIDYFSVANTSLRMEIKFVKNNIQYMTQSAFLRQCNPTQLQQQL